MRIKSCFYFMVLSSELNIDVHYGDIPKHEANHKIEFRQYPHLNSPIILVQGQALGTTHCFHPGMHVHPLKYSPVYCMSQFNASACGMLRDPEECSPSCATGLRNVWIPCNASTTAQALLILPWPQSHQPERRQTWA